MPGNPGVGKSTLMNMLAQKLLFKSGVSFGAGMTVNLQKEETEEYILMDTPGLTDIERRKEAAKQIETAMKMNGRYKIIFPIFLQAGRLLPQDQTLIKLILDAAPIDKYAILVNKLPKKTCQMLKQDPTERKHLMKTLFNGAGFKFETEYVYFNEKVDAWEDEKDVVPPMDQSLKNFIDSVPAVLINEKNVTEIKVDEYDELMKRYEDLMSENAKLQKEIQAAKDATEKVKVALDEQASRLDEAQAKAQIAEYNSVMQWACNNTANCWLRQRKVTKLTAVGVREQGNYGIVDVVIYDENGSQQAMTGNSNGSIVKVLMVPQGSKCTGMLVDEQMGYGIIDLKLLFDYGKTQSDWATSNCNQDIRHEIKVSAGEVTGFHVKEQGNYGIIDMALVAG